MCALCGTCIFTLQLPYPYNLSISLFEVNSLVRSGQDIYLVPSKFILIHISIRYEKFDLSSFWSTKKFVLSSFQVPRVT